MQGRRARQAGRRAGDDAGQACKAGRQRKWAGCVPCFILLNLLSYVVDWPVAMGRVAALKLLQVPLDVAVGSLMVPTYIMRWS